MYNFFRSILHSHGASDHIEIEMINEEPHPLGISMWLQEITNVSYVAESVYKANVKYVLQHSLFPFHILYIYYNKKFLKNQIIFDIHAAKYKRNTTPSAIINLIVGICVCLPNTNPIISRINKKPQAIQQKIVNVILPLH